MLPGKRLSTRLAPFSLFAVAPRALAICSALGALLYSSSSGWRSLVSAPDNSVEVLNETADFYRFFDCTDNAEFLYGCVEQTVEQDLPQEIEYLKGMMRPCDALMELLDMPDRMAEDLC